MTARILDGKGIAMTIRQEVAQRVSAFREKFGTSPKLVAVLVGQDPASQVYVRNKEIACQKAGIDSQVLKLDASTTTACLLETLDRLNQYAMHTWVLVESIECL